MNFPPSGNLGNPQPGSIEPTPIVSFQIPLRPRGSDLSGWEITCRLLKQTLGSILGQTNRHWMVSIAGHEVPDFLKTWNDHRIFFSEVDYASDQHKGNPNRDRNWKIAFAAMKAAPLTPHFHMALDADDLVRCDFVANLASHQENPAVVIQRGWEFDISEKRALRRNNLDAICGSTIVYRSKEFPMPQGRTWDEWSKVPALTVSHDVALKDIIRKGFAPWIPSRRLVAYLSGHQSSLSQRHKNRPTRRHLGFALLGKKIDTRLREEFHFVL